jgi:hypothetical protein
MPCPTPQNKKYSVNWIAVYLKTVGIDGRLAQQMLLVKKVIYFSYKEVF